MIEVWNPQSGKIRRDLEYQANDAFMLMDSAVTSLAFSRDGELLASGDRDGRLFVWKIQSGRIICKFERAHSESLTSIRFSGDGTQILSGSHDHMVRYNALSWLFELVFR